MTTPLDDGTWKPIPLDDEPYTDEEIVEMDARIEGAMRYSANMRVVAPPKSAAPTLDDMDLSNDWLYDWGDLPTTLESLKAWLKDNDIDVEDFKNSARYEANYGEFPWLKDL